MHARTYTYTHLQRGDLVVVNVCHLVVCQGGPCLVIDLKPGVELEPLQQLLEEVALRLPLGQLGQRAVQLRGQRGGGGGDTLCHFPLVSTHYEVGGGHEGVEEPACG